MAAQLGVAYSSIFSGFAVFAGGPYDCARDQDFYTSCMGNHTPSIEKPIAHIQQWSLEGQIDPIEHLRSSKVYLQTGALDEVVASSVMRQLEKQLYAFIPAEEITFVELEHAAHVFPTDFDPSGSQSSQCTDSISPYIANCNYDGVGEMLKWLYGTDTIQPRRNSGPPTGTLHEYAQEKSTGAIGLAHFGYYYIPSSCNFSSSSSSSSSLPCKLHIALHGCTMSVSQISYKFILDTGYVQYADSNHIILLFPQAAAVAQEEDHNNNNENNITSRPIWYSNGTEYPGAALACFDWVGWSGENADWRGGVQMEAIVKMVDVLTGGEERERGRRDVGGGDAMMGKPLGLMGIEMMGMGMGMGAMD